MKDNKFLSYEHEDKKVFGDMDSGNTELPNLNVTPEPPAFETLENPAENTSDRYYRIKQHRLQNINDAILDKPKETSSENSGMPERISPKAVQGTKELEQAFDEYFAENPEDESHRDFLTRIAKRESSFQNIQNTANAPAYGYFQLWKTNLGKSSPQEVLDDIKLQIKLAIDLDKRNLSTFTQDDFALAEKKGYTKNALRWGSWLGGPGNKEKGTGVRGFLYAGKDASDGHHYPGEGQGSSVSKYMAMGNYKEGGLLEEGKFYISVGDKKYNIKIAETSEEKSKGLSDKDDLKEDEGMLFVLDSEDKDEKGLIWFTMEDTKFPLDIIFIDNDYKVLQVSKGESLSKTPIYGSGDYVLEVSTDSGVKVGETLEFKTSEKINDKMLVLDSDGNSQMSLDGGERIFSIHNTKILIRFAKKSKATKKENDYKALGKRVFKFLSIQDSNEPEYV